MYAFTFYTKLFIHVIVIHVYISDATQWAKNRKKVHLQMCVHAWLHDYIKG